MESNVEKFNRGASKSDRNNNMTHQNGCVKHIFPSRTHEKKRLGFDNNLPVEVLRTQEPIDNAAPRAGTSRRLQTIFHRSTTTGCSDLNGPSHY